MIATDAGGIASFPDVPAGDYTYVVTASGHDPQQGTLAVDPGGICDEPVSVNRLPFEAQWQVTETSIPDIYDVTVDLTFQADQLQLLPLDLRAPCAGGPVSGVIEVLNPSAFAATNVQVQAQAPGVAWTASGQGVTIPAGQTALFPFTAVISAAAYGRGWIAASAGDVDGNWAPVRVRTCTIDDLWSWSWVGNSVKGSYTGRYPSFPGIDPPPFQGTSSIKLRLSQSAVLERQAFLADLTLSNAISDVTAISVRITARDAEGTIQPTHFTITPTVPTLLPGLTPYGPPLHQQWVIVPAYLGITEPATYTLRATLVYTLDGVSHISDSLAEVIMVRPQPEVHLSYFVPKHVRAGEPVLIGVRAENRGAGTARALYIDSAAPRLLSQQGRPISYQMLGTLESDQLKTGDMLLEFGDLAPGETAVGGWMMTFSHHGTFTELSVRCEHRDYQGMALSNLLFCDGSEYVHNNELQHLNDNECPDLSQSDKQGSVGGPINTHSGNYNYATTDLSLPTAGDALLLGRSYNSTSVLSDTDTFGPGWTHRYAMRLEFPDLGSGAFFTATTGDAVIDRSLLYYRPYVVVRLPGGSRLRLAENGDGTFTGHPGSQTSLTRHTAGGVVTYTLTAADETVRVFDAEGRLTLIRDRPGNETHLTYVQGRLSRVTGPLGARYLDFGYNDRGLVSWVRDPIDRTVQYGYDLDGNLTVVTDTRGLAWTYTYTGTHLLHEVFDPSDALIERTDYVSTTVRGEPGWRAVRQEDGAGTLLTLSYGDRTTTISRLDQLEAHDYDLFGTLVAETDPNGATQFRAYNWDFRPELQIDALGRTTGMAWAGCCGQLSAITDTLGHLTQLAYDGRSNLTGYTDAANHSTTYVYDEANHLLAVTDATGQTTHYAYNAHGRVISTTNAAGETTTYTYDAWGQRTALTDTAGLVTHYGYDAVGRLITTTAPTGLVTVNAYDDGDNLIRVTRNTTTAGGQNFLGVYNQVTAYGYDAVGRRTHVTDTLGLVTRSEYDAAGRLIRSRRNDLPGYPQNHEGTYNLVTAYGYDDLGRQVLVTDTLGAVTYTEYDAVGRVPRTWQHYLPGYPQNYQDAYNLVTGYGYDAVGNQTHVTDTLGTVTFTEYDDLNRVLRTWRNYLPGQPQNHQGIYNLVTTYGYDAVGNQVWVTDTVGLRTYTQYDAFNRPVTVTTNYVDGVFDLARPDEDLVQVTVYDPETGRMVWTVDPARRVTRQEYDEAGRVVTVTTNYVDGVFDPARHDEDVRQVTVYDPVTGRVAARLQVAGTPITTTYTYDVLGRLVATTDALSGTTTTEYDVLGRRSRSCDAAGGCTTYGYDAAGRLVTTTDSLSGTLLTTYDALGRRIAQTNPLGHTSVYTYDGAGRLVAQRDAEGGVTHYGYDALGRRTVVTDADGVATYSTYNALGQLVATRDALGHTTGYAYDALGRRTVLTDANGLATHYAYDDQGRLTAVTENYVPGAGSGADVNVRTEYAYDVLGSLRVITDALGHTTVYTYDLAGRRVAEADALGHVTRYTYDGHGRRTAATYPDAAGAFTVTTAYNALGWATEVVYPGVGDLPGFTVGYGYNPLGHRQAVTDATGTMVYDYDVLYRPLAIDAPTGEVGYAYNAAGQRTHLLYPTGETVTYTHDAAGRLRTVTDWDGGVTVYTYTAAGRLSGLARPNGVTSAYGYDGAGRLVEIEHRNGSDSLLARYTYALDGAGNRTAVTETLLAPAETSATMLDVGSRRSTSPVLTMSLLQNSESLQPLRSMRRAPGLALLLAPSVPQSIESELGAALRVATALVATMVLDDPPPDETAQVGDDLRQAEYRVSWVETTALADLSAAYQAPNRAHDFRTYFVTDGVRVVPRAQAAAGWELQIRLTAYGDETHRAPLPAARAPKVDGQRVHYQRGAVEEWYVNDERGLKQGFTVYEPLSKDGRRLLLELSLGGTLTATLADTLRVGDAAHATALEFISPLGTRVLRYDGLYVHDATGRRLPAALVPLLDGAVVDLTTAPRDRVPPEGGYEMHPEAHITLAPSSTEPPPVFNGLRIVVDTRDAVYPVAIDPVLTGPEWTVGCSQGGAHLGFSVSTAGDVNDDGYADIIVGAPKYDAGLVDTGWVGVYLGSAAGITTTGAWSAAGDQAGAQLGYNVATAGDVNGDGYADVIVGAPYYTATVAREGAAFVFLGSATGISTTSVQTLTAGQSEAMYGNSVGTAGDVNGDTYADVIVGAMRYDGAYSNEGAAFVYLGSANGMSATSVWSATGQQVNARYGVAVGAAGDVNDDGYADVVVGAELYDNGEGNEGRAYVYHGTAGGLSSSPAWMAEGNQQGAWFGHAVGTAGDIDGDGYVDVIVGAPYIEGGEADAGRAYVYLGSAQGLNATEVWSATLAQGRAAFGSSAGSAGDINGDGYADVIVGAYTYNGGQADEGAVFIYTGSASGLSATPVWSAESNQANARYGIAVGSAGDVNGDGAADVIVGAYGYANPQFAQGRAYVYHGVPTAVTDLVARNSSPTALGQATMVTATVSAGTRVSYTWAFGDGETGSGATATHTYPNAGAYTAVVTAANSVNLVTATTTVTITGGNPVSVTRSITYTYDGLHRLTAADYSTGAHYAYQYDAVGNRIVLTDTTGTTTYTYDAANRLTQIQLPDSSIQAYTWDARGNLLATGAFTYTYNAAGRMVRAESVNLTSVYTYTADGLRVQQAVDGGVTTFAWDWAAGVPELLSDGDKLYLVGHDTLGWADAAGWTYAVPDALGSVRQAVDASGAVLGAREWSPYGVEVGGAQDGLGYTGEWWDAVVGLQYLRARWYDAESGRFTATDPWEGSQQQPSTLNRYAYVVGNPVNLVDPTGLYAVADILALGCGSKPCIVHPIIEYIIGKIQADAASREIQEIYELNQARYYADAWVACQRMPWWQRLFFCPEHLQTAAGMDAASRIRALAQFGCLVTDGRTRPVCGQWDYKVDIGPRRDLGRNAQTINFCSIGVKDEVVFYYDIWANVHFGYLGMTGGFEPDMLLTGATLENMGSNLGAVTDDSSDQTCIGIGIHLYETGLTEGALLRQLYAHRDRLNKVRRVGPDQVFEVYQ